METKEIIEILTEHVKWRRSRNPYKNPGTMPYPPEVYGAALDGAIKKLKKLVVKEDGLHPLRVRLIRCITPKAKCDTARDADEDRAWNKVKGWVLDQHVEALEYLYKAPKSENVDETWRRKHGVAALLNQLREQVDLAENFRENNKPKPQSVKEPKGWQNVAQSLADDPKCPPNLRKALTLARTWQMLPPHVQSIVLERKF